MFAVRMDTHEGGTSIEQVQGERYHERTFAKDNVQRRQRSTCADLLVALTW